jgi:hypothetical protein
MRIAPLPLVPRIFGILVQKAWFIGHAKYVHSLAMHLTRAVWNLRGSVDVHTEGGQPHKKEIDK